MNWMPIMSIAGQMRPMPTTVRHELAPDSERVPMAMQSGKLGRG